jgi:hypothetical protein
VAAGVEGSREGAAGSGGAERSGEWSTPAQSRKGAAGAVSAEMAAGFSALLARSPRWRRRPPPVSSGAGGVALLRPVVMDKGMGKGER